VNTVHISGSVRDVSKLRVHNLAVSLDGFAAGEGQSLETPFGHAGGRLMRWFFPTRTFAAMTSHEAEAVGEGTTGVDDAFAAASQPGIGVEIMGRRKFGPQTGPWEDESWRGWWGEEPPFHTPVLVLTHHPRPDIAVGETTFLFRDVSPQEALAEAVELAGGRDVRLGGGATTVREFLDADLVDHLHVVVSPIVLGRGVRLWDGQEGLEDRFDIETTASPSGVVHHVFTRHRR
jgi:dihydrofolate reductase